MSESLEVLPLQEVEEYQGLQKLSERHKNAAALLAQGIPRQLVAEATQYAPEYITWLCRQELFKAYVRNMTAAAGTRLEALFESSVDTIADNLKVGGEVGLKAAKLQLEATGRIGRFQERTPQGGAVDRLEQLSDRLLGLLKHQRGRILNGEATVVSSEG